MLRVNYDRISRKKVVYLVMNHSTTNSTTWPESCLSTSACDAPLQGCPQLNFSDPKCTQGCQVLVLSGGGWSGTAPESRRDQRSLHL